MDSGDTAFLKTVIPEGLDSFVGNEGNCSERFSVYPQLRFLVVSAKNLIFGLDDLERDYSKNHMNFV